MRLKEWKWDIARWENCVKLLNKLKWKMVQNERNNICKNCLSLLIYVCIHYGEAFERKATIGYLNEKQDDEH